MDRDQSHPLKAAIHALSCYHMMLTTLWLLVTAREGSLNACSWQHPHTPLPIAAPKHPFSRLNRPLPCNQGHPPHQLASHIITTHLLTSLQNCSHLTSHLRPSPQSRPFPPGGHCMTHHHPSRAHHHHHCPLTWGPQAGMTPQAAGRTLSGSVPV